MKLIKNNKCNQMEGINPENFSKNATARKIIAAIHSFFIDI